MDSISEYMYLRIITKSTSVNIFICYVNNLNIFQIVFIIQIDLFPLILMKSKNMKFIHFSYG
jgi:hypothetical protein